MTTPPSAPCPACPVGPQRVPLVRRQPVHVDVQTDRARHVGDVGQRQLLGHPADVIESQGEGEHFLGAVTGLRGVGDRRLRQHIEEPL